MVTESLGTTRLDDHRISASVVRSAAHWVWARARLGRCGVVNSTTPVLPRAAVAAALALAGAVLVPGPGQAAVVQDCAGGPVTISSTIDDVTLTGVCTDVRIDASNITVVLPAAGSLTITGANLTISATGPVGEVAHAGSNNSLTAPAAGSVSVGGGNNEAVFAGAIGRTTVVDGNNAVRADSIARLVVKGGNHLV
jgi:hypothetical protein